MEEVAFFQTTVSKDPTTAYLGSFYKDGPLSLGFATSPANGATGWFYNTWNQKDNAWHKIFAARFEFDDSCRPFASGTAREVFERSKAGVSNVQSLFDSLHDIALKVIAP